MAAAAAPLTLGQVFQIKPLRRLWIAQLVSIFGDFLALFAVLSVVSFRLHGTPRQVTMISISFLLPMTFIGPLAGVFVDRWNVKRTMIASDLIRAALALLLVFASSLYQIYGILFALSAVSSFFMPAQTVTLRSIVPREGLMAANALMSQAMYVMRMISPSISGALVASVGEKSCYYVDSLSFIFSAAMISALVISRAIAPASAPQEKSVGSILGELTSGMKFILTHSALSFVMLSMAAGMFVVSCFGPLIAIYIRDLLSGGSVLFGLVNSCIGLGLIAGTQSIAHFARGRSKKHLVTSGLIGIGVSVLLMAAIKHTATTIVGAFGMGVGVAFIIVPAQTLLQTETPHDMLGRVSSSVMSLVTFSQVFGLVLSGSLAQWMGLTNLFYASAAMLMGTAAFGYFQLQKRQPDAGAPA